MRSRSVRYFAEHFGEPFVPVSPATSSREIQEDLELMLRIRKADPAALEALYDRHSSAVLGLCIRILRDTVEAEDVLIEVFHQIWERADRFDPSRASPLSYLMTVARSRAIDQLRAHRRRGRLVVVHRLEAGVEGYASVSEAGESPLHFALTGELQQRVRRALVRLTPEQRLVIDLSFFHGLTHREIAERLGAPLGTVKTRIRQALIRLRDGLQADDADLEVG